MKKTLGRIGVLITSLVAALAKAFDIRDVFVFGGIALLFHGLNLREPWIAYSVVGVVLILLGLGITSLIGKVRNGAPGRD